MSVSLSLRCRLQCYHDNLVGCILHKDADRAAESLLDVLDNHATINPLHNATPLDPRTLIAVACSVARRHTDNSSQLQVGL